MTLSTREETPGPEDRPPEVESTTWRALGTRVDLLTVRGDLERARRAVDEVIVAVDATYSRFRADSELVAVNARAGTTLTLSPLLASAVATAIRAARLTDGLCDPTVGAALRRIGYDDDFARIVERAEPIVLRLERVPGWRTLRFDERARTLCAPSGVELDLGSTGKALAADLAVAAAIDAMGMGGALVGLGGDLALAGEVPEGGWRVLAADDSATSPGAEGEVIAVRSGGMATSSTRVRRWRRGTVELHHLIDPRTGLPAVTPWRTVSVAAATCVDANAAATAATILGEAAPAWIEGLGLPARFVRDDGSIVRVAGWPGNRFDRFGTRHSVR